MSESFSESESIDQTAQNFKGKLIEWSQKNYGKNVFDFSKTCELKSLPPTFRTTITWNVTENLRTKFEMQRQVWFAGEMHFQKKMAIRSAAEKAYKQLVATESQEDSFKQDQESQEDSFKKDQEFNQNTLF